MVFNNYAIWKEIFCMSATRYKFISVFQGRQIRSKTHVLSEQKACFIAFRHITSIS